MQKSIEPFSQAAAALAMRIGPKDATTVQLGSHQAGLVSYWDGSRLFAVVSPSVDLDATRIVTAALSLGARNVEVIVVGASRSREGASRAELLGGALALQLSCFAFDTSVAIARSIKDVVAVTPAESLVVTPFVAGDLPVEMDVPSELRASAVLRFGEWYLEHLGLPFAKLDTQSGLWMPGVSSPENELLSLSMGEVAPEALALSARKVIASRRAKDAFGRFRSSLLSRWLGERLYNEPEAIGARAMMRVDVYRQGHLGVNPFSDLARTSGGFWGASQEYNDFLLAEMGDGTLVLLGVAGTLDPGVVVRTAEVTCQLRQRYAELRSAVVLGADGQYASHLVNLSDHLQLPSTVLVIASSWRDSPKLEVVGDGL